MEKKYDPVIVIIATSKKRTDLLIERSLRSVYYQEEVNPKDILIVDDNEKDNPKDKYSSEYHMIKKKVKEYRRAILSERFNLSEDEVPEGLFHTSVIPNKRTHGNSGTGAWNTAAFRALRYPKNSYLAFLDDDDEWHPTYLRKCLEVTNILRTSRSKKFITAVIAGITRREKDKEFELNISKKDFCSESFYIGNPGLQGSNLFIELRTFWEIGGFDESMPSATDRDLALRLIEYDISRDSANIKFIPECLVIHHAESYNRVTSIFENKRKGLDLFYRKYLPFMDEDVKKKSLERAKRLFNYQLPEQRNIILADDENNRITPIKKHPYNLLIGVISNNAHNLREFFKSFMNLPNKSQLSDYKIVILENTGDEYSIRPIIKYFSEEKDFKIEFISVERQKSDLKDYTYNRLFSDESVTKKSIAFSRSLLQYYLSLIAKEDYDNNCITWIIDDDAHFEVLIRKDFTNNIVTRPFDYLSDIGKLKSSTKFDAILGTVSDAPPLPFLSSLRTQLLDCYYNLAWLSKQDPEDECHIDCSIDYEIMKDNRDFYYDLSSEYYTHLEFPFIWCPINRNPEKIEDYFKYLLSDVIMLKKGTNVFRPIVVQSHEMGRIGNESIFRGGNTIIFNQSLLQVPNYSPTVEGAGGRFVLRRSDFNWALFQKYINNKQIQEATLPLRHHRRLQGGSFILDREKLTKDIFGMVFYKTLQSMFENSGIDSINDKDIMKATTFFKKKMKETIKNMKVNNMRSYHLVWRIIDILNNKKYWWYKNAYRPTLNPLIQESLSTLETLKYELGKRKFQKYIEEIEREGNRIHYYFLVDYIKKIRLINDSLK